MALQQRRREAGSFPSRRGKYLHGFSSRSGQARSRTLFTLPEIAEPLSARTPARRTKAFREMAPARRPRETQSERRGDPLVSPRDRGASAADGPENVADQSRLAKAIPGRSHLDRQTGIPRLVASRISRLLRVRVEDRARCRRAGRGRNAVASRDEWRVGQPPSPGPARRE